MEKEQLVPFHCSLFTSACSWLDPMEKCSQAWSFLSWSSLILFFPCVLSIVMEGSVSPPTQLLMFPGGSQLVVPGSKWHLNISSWDCFYVNTETCETSQWIFRYKELGTIFGSGFWKHLELVPEWDGAESDPEPLQAPSAGDREVTESPTLEALYLKDV